MELANVTWKDDQMDCEGVGIWTKYGFYTIKQLNKYFILALVKIIFVKPYVAQGL